MYGRWAFRIAQLHETSSEFCLASHQISERLRRGTLYVYRTHMIVCAGMSVDGAFAPLPDSLKEKFPTLKSTRYQRYFSSS